VPLDLFFAIVWRLCVAVAIAAAPATLVAATRDDGYTEKK